MNRCTQRRLRAPLISGTPSRIATQLGLLCFGLAHVADAGINVWTTDGLQGATVNGLAVDPVTPTTLYAATGEAGVLKSSDSGTSWKATELPEGRLLFDPRTPSTLYAGASKSTDGGGSWRPIGPGPVGGGSIVLDPHRPNTLYSGGASIQQVSACVGDCNDAGPVTIDELLTMVNIAFGNVPVSQCISGPGSQHDRLTIGEILTAVNNGLAGCPTASTAR